MKMINLLVLAGYLEHGYSTSIEQQWDWPPFQSDTVVSIGQKVHLGWSPTFFSWFGTSTFGDNNNLDFWLVDNVLRKYQHIVDSSIAVIMDSGFDWTIEVPEIELLEISTWEFEVFASGVSPNDTDFQYMRSPAFVILPRSTSAPPKYNDSIASTCSPTVVTNYVQKSSDLSTGAKAGIAVGAVAGAIALFTSGWIVASWRGRKRAHNSDMARRLDPDLPKPPVSIPESPIEKDSTASPNFVQKKALPEPEPVMISVNEQSTPQRSTPIPPVEKDSVTWPDPLRIKPGPRSEALGGESNEQSTTKLSPPEEPGRTSSFDAARCRSPIEMPVCPWRDE